MQKRIFYFALLFSLSCRSANRTTAMQETTSDSPEIAAQDLQIPWGMDLLPDGRILLNERPGRINVLDLKTHTIKNLAQRDIWNRDEGGLLGLAVDPDFSATHYFFIYETIESGNRIVRMKMENDAVTEDKILVDSIPRQKFHDGGILRFGPDGYLYAGTGDAREPQNGQNLLTLAGKVLRMDKDGNIPADNPFHSYVWSYGHRNIQGFCWDDKGNMYASEHGPSGEINGWCCHDELNKIEKGKNYGWPLVIGNDTHDGVTIPLCQSGDDTWAPGGIAFVKNKNGGGGIYMACLRGEKILVLNSSDGYKSIHEKLFEEEFGRLRNILLLPNGDLLFGTSNRDGRGNPKSGDDKIYRVSSNNQ